MEISALGSIICVYFPISPVFKSKFRVPLIYPQMKRKISSTSSKQCVCYLIHVAADSSRNSDLGSATVAVLERRQEINY